MLDLSRVVVHRSGDSMEDLSRLKCKRGQKSFSEEAVGHGRWARDAEDARSWPGLVHRSGDSMEISAD